MYDSALKFIAEYDYDNKISNFINNIRNNYANLKYWDIWSEVYDFVNDYYPSAVNRFPALENSLTDYIESIME